MPAGFPYFAWIDPTETTFTSGHMRWDENVFSFKLSQQEGDPAALTLVVRRPRNSSGDPIGLLSPGRKIWCWFALDCGPSLIKFRGRLVGVPTSILEELVTLDFVAKPVDLVAQKNALATTLAVLPYYDNTLIDPSRGKQADGTWGDPEVVLEGYTAIWHYDRETHVLTISDEVTGEDGLVSFDQSDAAHSVLHDGLAFNLTTAPLTRVDLTAEFSWTTTSGGTVDLTQWILGLWPRPPAGSIHHPTQLNSIPLDESNWPRAGASLGSGWTVADASATNLFNFNVSTETTNSQIKTIFPDGDTVTGTSTHSESKLDPPGGPTLGIRTLITNDETRWTTEKNPGDDGGTYTANFTQNVTQVKVLLGLQEIRPTLIATYAANRQMSERIKISLIAHVQPILTDPAASEPLVIDNIRSVNLSDTIDGVIPIGDQNRQSYITTARGNQAIEHCILLMRANLMKRARVVEFTFAPKLERMPEITLRKNALLVEPRVGDATGKIIFYSVALDGATGKVDCQVKIGCTIGYGGTITTTPGTPVWASVDWVGADWQQFTGRTVTVTGTSSTVTFSPPNFVPTGGINFMTTLTPADVIEVPLTVEWGDAPAASTLPPEAMSGADALTVTTEFVKDYWLPQFETQATFKLKDVTGDLSSDYTIATSVLEIPAGYNLEAA